MSRKLKLIWDSLMSGKHFRLVSQIYTQCFPIPIYPHSHARVNWLRWAPRSIFRWLSNFSRGILLTSFSSYLSFQLLELSNWATFKIENQWKLFFYMFKWLINLTTGTSLMLEQSVAHRFGCVQPRKMYKIWNVCIIERFALWKGGDFNIHIWALFGVFIC